MVSTCQLHQQFGINTGMIAVLSELIVNIPIRYVADQIVIEDTDKSFRCQNTQIIFRGTSSPHDGKGFYYPIIVCLHPQIIVQQPGGGRHPQEPSGTNY